MKKFLEILKLIFIALGKGIKFIAKSFWKLFMWASWTIRIIILAVIAVAIFLIVLFIDLSRESVAEVTSIAALREIVYTSEVSTWETPYSGVCTKMNKDEPEEIDYHVSYNAEIKAGINFEEVEIELDERKKKYIITLPEAEITEVIVDIATLDFMFKNNRSETETVTEEAYKACIKDVEREVGESEVIYEIAIDNAKNAISALTKPIIEQLNSDYTLEIK